MDLGLGNLADVKTFVLPPALVLDTQYDSVLATLASGVAGRFASYCNRKFSRVVGDQAIFAGTRTQYIVPRYPFEVITRVELSSTVSGGWTDITSAVIQQDPKLGWIYFGCSQGDPTCLVRCTYTGGYFYETLEPLTAGVATAGYPTAVPAGSALVPPELKQSWLSQVLHEFELKDRLLPEGIGSSGKNPKSNWRLDQMQLLPEVANAIAQFRRFI